MRRILVDSDVILDLFLDRQPHHDIALHFFSYLEVSRSRFRAFTSPVVIANVAYILAKVKSSRFAIDKIAGLRQLLHVATMSESSVDSAVSDPHKDLEDSLQYYCAIENQIGVVVTRNGSDYPKTAAVVVVAPSEFLAMDQVETGT